MTQAGATTAGASPRPDAAELPKRPPWITTLRAEPPALLGKLLGLACILAVVGAWYLLTAGAQYNLTIQGGHLSWTFDPTSPVIISPAKLPSPTVVFGSYGDLEDPDVGGGGGAATVAVGGGDPEVAVGRDDDGAHPAVGPDEPVARPADAVGGERHLPESLAAQGRHPQRAAEEGQPRG